MVIPTFEGLEQKYIPTVNATQINNGSILSFSISMNTSSGQWGVTHKKQKSSTYYDA